MIILTSSWTALGRVMIGQLSGLKMEEIFLVRTLNLKNLKLKQEEIIALIRKKLTEQGNKYNNNVRKTIMKVSSYIVTIYIIQMCFGITRGRVFNGELYTQSF